jgi:hypothetical protein
VAAVVAATLSAAALTVFAAAPAVRVGDGWTAEVVAVGLVRPIQLAFDGDGRLVVLSHGRRGDAAGEIAWIELTQTLPVDAAPLPRLVIPFAEGRRVVFGSLAVDERTGEIYLGEENGNRVYHLARDARLRPAAVGVQHLVGGSGIALDARGRLLALDFSSPDTQRRAESPLPPALDPLIADGGYQGPLVFRVELPAAAALPRRLDLVPPLFPRPWARSPGEPLGRFMSVAALAEDRVVVLDSLGELHVVDASGGRRRLARLPAGHYHRTSMAVAPDGSVLVSSGFHIRRIYRITMGGEVSVVAAELGDPNGIAVDREGRIYVAETAYHRISRIRPAG